MLSLPRIPAVVLSLLSCSLQQAGDLGASVAQGFQRKRCLLLSEGAPHPPTTSSPLQGSHCPFLYALGPTGTSDLQILSPYGRAFKEHLTDRMFLLHVISPNLCRLYYIRTVLTPRHSAYGTLGIICLFLTQRGYFSYANFCLHALLFLMLFSFYP